MKDPVLAVDEESLDPEAGRETRGRPLLCGDICAVAWKDPQQKKSI